MNAPTIETARLRLREFSMEDLPAVFAIYSDETVNTYLPWFPLQSLAEADVFFNDRFGKVTPAAHGYQYAICLKADNTPIGHVQVGEDDGHDLGFALKKEFWAQGIVSEACRAVLLQTKKDGIPYLTATHDVNNLRSGYVMRSIGMTYQYSYVEQWQPKNLSVIFRMYQLNLADHYARVYNGYWHRHPIHFVEAGL